MNHWFKHPIKYLRLITTPKCSTCKNCVRDNRYYNPRCSSRWAVERCNRLNADNMTSVPVSYVRGTRFCDYEEAK